MRTCQKVCNECRKQASINGGDDEIFLMCCQLCEDCYHSKCVRIQSAYIIGEIRKNRFQWTCYKCQSQTLDSVLDISLRMEEMSNSVEAFNKQFTDLKLITAGYEVAVRNLNAEIQQLKASTNSQVAKLENEIQQLQTQKVEKTEMERLYEVIDQLQSRINDLENSKAIPNLEAPERIHTEQLHYLSNLQRRDDLIIQGIPDLTNESESLLKQTVVKLASSCGTILNPNQIKKVHRLKRKAQSSENNNNPTSILVRLSDENLKENIFSSYLKSFATGNVDGLRLSCLGLEPSTKRIYLNHHLSPELMKIKTTALQMKKDGMIQRVISKYNQIRIQHDGAWHKVTSTVQLDTLRNQFAQMSTTA